VPGATSKRSWRSASVASGVGLTNREIIRIVNRYIGVSGGYLGDFSYRTHAEFYPEYCDLDLNPFDYLEEGTTRDRFITVLQGSLPPVQAKIVRGVLEKYPIGSDELRTQAAYDELVAMAERLERGRMVTVVPPAFTSAVVARALDDAEALLREAGPTSAVDRVHTSLHGHLRYLCDEAGIVYDRDATMVALLKKLRNEHPKLRSDGPRDQDIERILNASGSILDVLNPVRNNASVAHPNAELLGRAEAELVVNVGRSLLAYLDAKVSG
jgi:Abortive infection C-terminus